ncbi:MAG: ATP-binding protein, partial [Acidobacteriaceae bacterium]|nr:ATP-binding protein [Acidobacteriaceae bacterium]
VDDVIAELEAKIALPFENQALARRLQLKPKRGVLLAGPPGTGKTTIGRALAHRLRSKFFLIDGTVVAGSREFYTKVECVFAGAKRNAPSIIFIDDADVIFEEGNQGFYRYLLTMMDGLESASADRVCVMLTAMEVTSLPRAMLRSGRIELWLHIGLPAEDARKEILREKLEALPQPLSEVDLAQLAQASRGLTGADLKAVVEDAKLLFAHDQVQEKHGVPIEQYFLRAIAGIRSNQANYRSRKGTSSLNTSIGYPIE